LRQYASVLRTATAMLEPHELCIEWLHLPDDVQYDLSPESAAVPVRHWAPAPTPSKMPLNLAQLSQSAIHQALASSGGNVSQAARHLGISRQTLYRKLNG
jgi:transcriptional regulator of acetoin/glycerol metabolism